MAKKTVDIKAMTADELKTKLDELHKSQFNMRFQKATGQMENTAEVRKVRREIARVKTALTALNKKAAGSAA